MTGDRSQAFGVTLVPIICTWFLLYIPHKDQWPCLISSFVLWCFGKTLTAPHIFNESFWDFWYELSYNPVPACLMLLLHYIVLWAISHSRQETMNSSVEHHFCWTMNMCLDQGCFCTQTSLHTDNVFSSKVHKKSFDNPNGWFCSAIGSLMHWWGGNMSCTSVLHSKLWTWLVNCGPTTDTIILGLP